MTDNTQPLITIDEAVKLTGRTHGAIVNWVSKRKVVAFKDSTGAWLMPRDAVIKRHNTIRKTGAVQRIAAAPQPEQRQLIEQRPKLDPLTIEHVAQITVSLAVLRLQCGEVRHELVRHLADDLAWLLERAIG
jgi:hypothetical protein